MAKTQSFADMFIQDGVEIGWEKGANATRQRILRFLEEENKDGSLDKTIARIKSLPLTPPEEPAPLE